MGCLPRPQLWNQSRDRPAEVPTSSLARFGGAGSVLSRTSEGNGSRPGGAARRCSVHAFPGIRTPADAVTLPFTKIPHETVEKEARANGVTAQAGRMQQGPAQGSAGEFGGVHQR